MAAKEKNRELIDGYLLDHGGIIYPYIARSDWNQVFRLEAELDEDIDVQNVVRSLLQIRKKFPSFFVVMEKRKFLFILKRTDELPDIIPEGRLCRHFNLEEKEKPLFRMTYSGNRLGIELFHSVADGTGALIFFVNLLAQYYINKGIEIELENDIFNHGFKFEKSDTENSFLKFFDPKAKGTARSEKPAYQYCDGTADCEMRLTTFKFDVDAFKAQAKNMNATVTQLLTAVYTKAFCMAAVRDDKFDKNIKIEVPMNLRKKFNSSTLRNFSLYFNTSVPPDSADAPLEDIIEILKPQFALGADNNKLTNDIHTNVSQSEMAVFRGLPTSLKKGLLKIGSKLYGERLFTSPLSNVGIITLPEEISGHVTDFGFIIGRTLKNTVYSGVLTYNGKICWCLTSVVKTEALERDIVKIIESLGIEVEVNKR